MAVTFDEMAIRISDGLTLTDEDAGTLAASSDIVTIGMLADGARRRRHGSRTTFLRVADLSVDDTTRPQWPAAAREVRLVGQPSSLDALITRVRRVLDAAGPTPVSASSLGDLEELARREAKPPGSIFDALVRAGLRSIADAPFDRLTDAEGAIRAAAAAGLTIARVTMAHVSREAATVLFRRLNALQRSSGLIRAFAPLARSVSLAHPSTGYDDVKRVAMARLLVDTVETIQVDWTLYGPKLAQVALTFGADDVDGVTAEDDDSLGPRRAPLEEIRRNIEAAGFVPVERNGRFESVPR